MNKLTVADPETRSVDLVSENIAQLKTLFPETFAEGKIDFAVLRQLLGDAIDEGTEKYGLNWHGKWHARRLALLPSAGTLRPCPDESLNWDATQNLMIEGDNLEVLKLLQKSYYGKVKLIYIDPPYNTGKDFIYPDNYKDGIQNYLKITGQLDDNGQNLSSNTDASGRFHTKWLNMMYPRLKIARNMLRNDGILVISISDSEVHNLRACLDEIFGIDNLLGCVMWKSTKSVTNTALISVSHTYNLIYARNRDYFVENRMHFRLLEEGEGFSNPDNDPRGPWKADPFQVGGERPNQRYPITNPKTGAIYRPNPGNSWKNEQKVFEQLRADNRIVFGVNGDAGPQRTGEYRRYRGRFSRQCFCRRRRQNQPHRNFATVRHQRRTQFIGRTMKFQFEPDLDYQRKAIDAVCDLFRGQEACRSEFTASHALTEQGQLGFAENDLGVGNRLALSEDALLANLQDIQLRNGLRPSSGLDSHDFSVEMETGTGKTYVYLRTIFELNKRYGFTKFAIVVPSIAIKEGVDKSLAMMRDHFRALYSGAPFEHFIYDSTQLGQVRNFATSPQIQIMVMTVGAINKRNINSIYHENEKTGGEKPIDLVRATHPILIVDEPQSVDGGLKGRGKEALETMNPLCTLRYSATHIDLHHPVYRLNAVDAYERKLVKQIEVSAGTVIDDYNRPYVRLVATRRQRGVISARVELTIKTQTGSVRRQIMVVQDGDSLERKTRYAIYHNHHIGEIRVERGNEYLELRLPGTEHWLREGEAYGDVENRVIQREMIRRTIHEHLEKEKGLHREGIKVLTLFFLDKVAHYRDYDEDGNAIKGEYARIFEEEYRRAANNPNYRALFEGVSDLTEAAEQVHNGYFSIDKRGGWTDTAENDQTARDNAERAYNLIMRDKEKLLSFAEPLKFIFSHSALREGWDNPNVFQICALRDIQAERERRQTIGRGLRLCVNQAGQRQRGFEVNTLTVIARESYEDFADNLQREIEEETGTRFGTVEPHQFASIQVRGEDDQTEYLGLEQSQMLWEHFKARGYIDADQKIADALTLDAGNFALPAHFEPLREAIAEVLRKANGRIVIKDRNERRRAHPREAVLNGEEFKALWDRIKYKTTYRVKFDNEELIKKCSETLRDAPPIPRTRLQWNAADLRIGEAGVQAKLREQSAAINLVDDHIALPDVFTELQNRTQLTRRSIQRILAASGRLDDFCVNPQKFIEIAAEAINRRKRLAVVDGIKYQRLGADAYYAQELFMSGEMTGYIKNMLVSQKSAYDHVVYDSANEAAFADQLKKNIAIKVYAKLPRWFQVPTPLGGYTPDWAVLVEDGDGERLYFVAETKSTAFLDDLRNIERAKVACGRAHFSALKVGESPIEYRVVHTLDELMADEEKNEHLNIWCLWLDWVGNEDRVARTGGSRFVPDAARCSQ